MSSLVAKNLFLVIHIKIILRRRLVAAHQLISHVHLIRKVAVAVNETSL
jgi:hypothetical protein